VLETRKRQLKKEMKTLSQEDETRRKELGGLLRAGSIFIGKPFDLRLDWWDDDSADVPKTWAGSQEVLRIARAALASSTDAFATDSPFEYVCVMRSPSGETAEDEEEDADGEERDEAAGDKVEPFYFDADRGAHARPLDIGFSPNKLKHLTLAASPATEFLCLVGLQRHRPKPTNDARVFEYCTWAAPLTSCVAQAAVSGLLPHVDGRIFRFENAFRTDQRKHKGFTPATSFPRREQ
jgi:CRISPR-associated protein Csb3